MSEDMKPTVDFEEVIAAQTQEFASMMADIFFEHSEYNEETGERLATEAGLEEMAEMFGSIEPYYRADVYIALIEELGQRGIEFDPRQFQTETVH